MRELSNDTLVVFVSDSHIGGDPGCDGFESPAELEALFAGLAAREGPVELILAGDFFDFLQIGKVPEGEDRASLTMDRPEYRSLFAALGRLREAEGKRVIYLPGNHDAESFWNAGIQETLRGRGLVDEFAYRYLASMEVDGERRVIYCEHGNQLDPANTVEDYHDALDTPLGHHVVMDFTRRLAPFGKISGGLDLAEIKMVYPLVAIPRWITGRYFYDFLGKIISYLLLPLLVAYLVYRVAAYLVAAASRQKVRSILAGEARAPMDADLDATTVDVFVSGHTHLPSLEEVQRADGSRAVMVNSGCFLRQLQPVSPRLKGPPVFVSRFVLTHVRVFVQEGALRVELWEQPKPAQQRLTRLERLLSWGRRPQGPSPGA